MCELTEGSSRKGKAQFTSHILADFGSALPSVPLREWFSPELEICIKCGAHPFLTQKPQESGLWCVQLLQTRPSNRDLWHRPEKKKWIYNVNITRT